MQEDMELQALRTSIRECERTCLLNGDLHGAIRAHDLLGENVDIPREDLITCGDRAFSKYLFWEAIQAYARAGDTKERLIGIGDVLLGHNIPDHLLRTNRLQTALYAYMCAPTVPPRERFVAYGNAQFSKGNFAQGSAAYNTVQLPIPRAQLMACGDAFKRLNDMKRALQGHGCVGVGL